MLRHDHEHVPYFAATTARGPRQRDMVASKGDTKRLWQTFQDVLGEPPTSYGGTQITDSFIVFLTDRLSQFEIPPP